ncbi:hypothetical protein [Sphaerisporangium corydalis]|uniref:Uncharacterized protein n=1 Tax=Sphaerisporangium corydalis TaxID=1441875 RepID=A0ABV9EEF8_9ACTN|nr:hypothetical protein [Sphaerisporangium corydalis]
MVALVVAYRKQRVTEAGESRKQAKLHAERFDKAGDKLGNDSAAVRLAGVHALAALADDWTGGRQSPAARDCQDTGAYRTVLIGRAGQFFDPRLDTRPSSRWRASRGG